MTRLMAPPADHHVPRLPDRVLHAHVEELIRSYWRTGQQSADDLRQFALELRESVPDGLRLHDEILAAIASEHLPEHEVRRNQKRMVVGTSFGSRMASQYQFVKAVNAAGGRSPGDTITEKNLGRAFAERLGLAVPEVLDRGAELAELVPIPGTVIKPTSASGSRGVFLVHSDRDFFEVRFKRRYDSFEAVKRRIAELRSQGLVRSRRWVVERMLTDQDGNPPTDLKFYTFYGEIGLVLEVSRRTKDRYCWYDGSGREVQVGKYADKRLHGRGVEPGWLDEIRRVSRRIPSPFMRIDTYPTTEGLVYGEFTARPGAYEQFDLATDRSLGKRHVDAEGRLYVDLMQGTRFEEFETVVGD